MVQRADYLRMVEADSRYEERQSIARKTPDPVKRET